MRWNLEPPWAATPYQAISDQTIPNINNSFNVVLYQKLPNHTETYNAITTRQWAIVAPATASKKKNNCKLGLCGVDPQHSLPGIKKTRAANIYIYQYIYRGRKITYIPVYTPEGRQSKTQSWHHHLVHLSSLYSSIDLIPSIHTFHILTVVGCKTPQSKHRPERTAPDNIVLAQWEQQRTHMRVWGNNSFLRQNLSQIKSDVTQTLSRWRSGDRRSTLKTH